MESLNEYRSRVRADYMEKLTPLFEYIPYFSGKEGKNTRSTYSGDGKEAPSVPVPIYDPKVIAFVKAAQKTGLVNRNYVYQYRRLHVDNPKDERLYVSGAGFKDIDAVISIMSKYVIEGMTKGVVWGVAVEEGVWLHCLIKLKELLEIYDHPLA